MIKFSYLFLFALISCSGEESAVKDYLTKSVAAPESSLEVSSIKVGEKKVATDQQKKNLALLGLKDATTYPVTVSFKAKEDCVAVAVAIKNDIFFKEKTVSCRTITAGQEPNLKYVKAYESGKFGQLIPIYENGKVIKAGETFTAVGEWAHLVNAKDEKKSATVFQRLE